MEKRVRCKPCPWISSEIKHSIRDRDNQLHKSRKTNKAEDWSAYRKLHNYVMKLVKQAKLSYNRRLIEENMHDPKGFWKTINKIMPGEKREVSVSFIIDDKICMDKKEMAVNFNKFFTSTVGRLVQSIILSVILHSCQIYYHEENIA